MGSGAVAADLPTKAPPIPYAGVDDFWTRPYLFGDLGRTRLKEQGISLALTLGDEAVTNLSGGSPTPRPMPGNCGSRPSSTWPSSPAFKAA